jgi:uncharacterized protein
MEITEDSMNSPSSPSSPGSPNSLKKECPKTAERLVAGLKGVAREAVVADVRIGLGYTAVKLSDERTGVAYTFRDEAKGGCSVFEALRPLVGRSAVDLLALLESKDAIEAGVGLACANALVNKRDSEQIEGDILDHLGVGPEDDVGMVGNFGPLVRELERRARSLTIFERISKPMGMLRPQEEAFSVLPRCRIALITATSIINGTIDGLLEAAGACRRVVLLGASTPLWAEAFTATNVTMLSGVVVTKPADVLQVVSEGGGMRQFSPYVSKVTVMLKREA